MKRPGEFSTENGTRGPNEVGQIAASAAVPDPDVLSSVVANELSQLSTEAREAAFHDLHGIPRNEDKTPDEINELINEVTDQLTRRRQKPAYAKALFLCPSYVNDPGFILMFLRAEDFDVKLAVKRIISHFEQKLQLFGIEKLARKITYEDFDEEDKVALHRGGTQILPYKDSSGRAIGIGLCEKMVSHTKIASQLRVMWYLAMSVMEGDKTVKRNGFVFIRYSVGQNIFSDFHFKLIKKSSAMSTGALPIYTRGFHVCYDSLVLRMAIATLQTFLGRRTRARFRCHYGSHSECLDNLASYGIRREFIPIDSDGNVDNTELLKLLETFQRKEAEEKEKTDEGVIKCPSANDVLLGRGKPYQEYLGNSRMNEMIDERREAYQAASKIQKTAFRDAVLKLIQDSNGRFLKKSDEDENLWVEVGENVARDKISHSFCRRL